jgi:hypothetical protein
MQSSVNDRIVVVQDFMQMVVSKQYVEIARQFHNKPGILPKLA